MIRMPINRAATQRALRQAVRPTRNVVDQYLTAFQVTDLSLKTVPGCLNPDFDGEWRAFLKANQELHGEPARKALRAVLSFLRYCKDIRLDPFATHFTFRDPLTGNAKLDLNKIRRTVVAHDLSTTFKFLKSYVDKYRIQQYFRVHRTKTSVTKIGNKPKLVTTWVLAVSNPRQTLDGVLAALKGNLYDNKVPPQIMPMKRNDKDARPHFDTLLTGVGTVGWYPLVRNAEFDLMVIRAKSGFLVLKAIVHLEPTSLDNGDVAQTDKVRIWTKFKLIS